MLRGLTHHWRLTLSVLLAAAVATTVLVGAVIVGDSLRASLRRLTLDRLGGIDWSLVADQPFREALVEDVHSGSESRELVAAPAFILRGSAVEPDSGRVAGGVRLIGIDARFGTFYGGQGAALTSALEPTPGQLFPTAVVNRSLATELDVEAGDSILLNVRQMRDIPRESLLGNRPDARQLAGLRVTVTRVLPDRGPGRFDLESHQAQPRNAFVSLAVLQRRLDRPGRVNALLVGDTDRPAETASLGDTITRAIGFEDLGLRATRSEGVLRISNRRFVLRDRTVEAVDRLAGDRGCIAQTVLGYLANGIRHDESSVPYSVVLGVDLPVPDGLGELTGLDGEPIGSIGAHQIVLSEWAARDLDAAPGDEIQLDYLAVGADDSLERRSARFVVGAVAAMRGLVTDGDILPEFPGIAEADDIAAWEPPFPMDLDLIRPRDEEFWDRYGAAPKAIVDLDTAQSLWGSRFGRATVARVACPAGELDEFVARLAPRLEPSWFGLVPQPVKQQGLEASTGSTDFAGLFLAFSFFLIGAAALIVGLLFSLSVELRASEIGLRRALGFPLGKVRRLFLAEGLVVAALGGLAGIALAVAYAAALTRIISDLWSEQLDLPLLALDLDPVHIAGTFLAAALLVAATVVATLRRLRHSDIPALLRSDLGRGRSGRGSRLAGPLALACLALTLATLVASGVAGEGSSPAYFFAAGAFALVGGLAGFAWWMGRSSRTIRRPGWGTPFAMATRNGAFNPRRSLLAVSLVCCASFLLVSVAANRREFDAADLGRDSGTGGFTVVAESAIPLPGPLDDPETLGELDLESGTLDLLETVPTYSLRLRPGEDASCLNLYRPRRPRIVGIPRGLIERDGFRFTSVVEETENPWSLLERSLEPGVIPAIGDANSVTWILHAGLGEEIEMVDDRGETVRLRLVALLDKSIFQSELLIAESAFLDHFPEHGGYPYFLVETAPGEAERLIARLEGALADYGLDATGTAAKLARFLGIEEMYLSTFQLLGGLGLILGTVGLGVVLLRNVNERRGELAMLRAVGFRRRAIGWIVGLETALHLVVGLAIGSAAGLLALTPHLLDASLDLPYAALGGTLATVVVVGLASTALGVAIALRAPLLPALKAE